MELWRRLIITAVLLAFVQVGLRSIWGLGAYLHEMSSIRQVSAVIESVDRVLDRMPGGPGGRVGTNTALVEVRYRYVDDIPRTSTSLSLLCGPCKAGEVSALFENVPLDSLPGKTVTAYVSRKHPARAYLFLVKPIVLWMELAKALAWIAGTSAIVLLVGGALFSKNSCDE